MELNFVGLPCFGEVFLEVAKGGFDCIGLEEWNGVR